MSLLQVIGVVATGYWGRCYRSLMSLLQVIGVVATGHWGRCYR